MLDVFLAKRKAATEANAGRNAICSCQGNSNQYRFSLSAYSQWIVPHPGPKNRLEGCSFEDLHYATVLTLVSHSNVDEW
jgi:hypothetical protein